MRFAILAFGTIQLVTPCLAGYSFKSALPRPSPIRAVNFHGPLLSVTGRVLETNGVAGVRLDPLRDLWNERNHDEKGHKRSLRVQGS